MDTIFYLFFAFSHKCNIERKLARYWQHTLSRSEKAVLPRGSRGGSWRRAGCLAWWCWGLSSRRGSPGSATRTCRPSWRSPGPRPRAACRAARAAGTRTWRWCPETWHLHRYLNTRADSQTLMNVLKQKSYLSMIYDHNFQVHVMLPDRSCRSLDTGIGPWSAKCLLCSVALSGLYTINRNINRYLQGQW